MEEHLGYAKHDPLGITVVTAETATVRKISRLGLEIPKLISRETAKENLSLRLSRNTRTHLTN